MASAQIQARHVFHAATTGWDRIQAWREATGEPAFVWGLGSRGEEGLWFGPVKRAFRKWAAATADAGLTLYHDGAGADALGPLDACPHKILFLHHWVPRWESYVDWTIRCTGKVLVGQPAYVAAIRGRFGWVPERFIQVIPQPPLRPAVAARDGAGSGPRTGIWLHGRSWRRHGNRLRAIADRWSAADGQLEVICSGAGRPSWARPDKVVWSSGLPLEFALLRLHTWDSTLLLNDFSLDAPWLLEALRLGCFPLVPEGGGVTRAGSWQAEWAPSPYPWGDTAAALDLLGQWRREQDELRPAFDQWRRALLGAVPSAGDWPGQWDSVKRAFLAQRAPGLRLRKPVAAWYPVAWYERVQRLRMGV